MFKLLQYNMYYELYASDLCTYVREGIDKRLAYQQSSYVLFLRTTEKRFRTSGSVHGSSWTQLLALVSLNQICLESRSTRKQKITQIYCLVLYTATGEISSFFCCRDCGGQWGECSVNLGLRSLHIHAGT